MKIIVSSSLIRGRSWIYKVLIVVEALGYIKIWAVVLRHVITREYVRRSSVLSLPFSMVSLERWSVRPILTIVTNCLIIRTGRVEYLVLYFAGRFLQQIPRVGLF